MDKKTFTPWIKLNRANRDQASGKYADTATYPDGETVQFEFVPEDFTTSYGDVCIGKVFIPGREYPISIKVKENRDGKIYHSGCVDYEKGRYVNINITPTEDSIKEFTIGFTKVVVEEVDKSGDPF